ncbi:MAG: sigma 54-interacting transcriptional regulator [Syntrophobacteraceae bacterium]
MKRASVNICKVLSEELNPEKLQRNFLNALLELQRVERGSIWVQSESGYKCVEAVGSQSDKVKGITISADQPSIVGWVIQTGKMTIAEPGKDVRHFKELEEQLTVKSKLILCFPLILKSGEVYGAVQIIDTSSQGVRLNLDKDYLLLLQEIVDIGSIALSNSLIHEAKVQENLELKQAIQAIHSDHPIIGRSSSILNVLKVASEYAKSDFPVLITGESGTGKELIAREIHRQSNRRDKPFLVQNCSAIPDTLLESELFGYMKGAFTGAFKDKTGLFEAANEGTLFLDEIGDMPPHLQARILRVIQDNEIKPLGGTKTKQIDVRIVSATNRDLKEAIVKELFREDLFYRLNVLPIHIPPLRERREDIILLLDHFIRKESLRMGIPVRKISKEALEYLLQYPWKGNIRELENFVKHIMIVADSRLITPKDLSLHFTEIPAERVEAPNVIASLQSQEHDGHHASEAGKKTSQSAESVFCGYSWEELERDYVLYILDKNKWHITRAAKEAGVNRSTFDSRMKKLGIRKT